MSWHTFAMLSFSESELALRSGSVVAATNRDVVVVDGPEAASYLHGQVSQNIEGMAIGATSWTLLLEPAGRVTAWARISRVGEERFFIDVDAGFGEAMLTRLERFKLRTKAEFAMSAAQPVAAVRGPLAPGVEAIRAAVAESDEADDAVVVDLSWPTSAGADVFGLDAAVVAKLTSIDLGDPAVVELERIESGRPAMGAEFAEKTIPAETGVVELSADFTKGCYVGQELVARVDSRGNNTPRTVHPASSTGDIVPPAGSEVLLDGDVVGTVTSATPRETGVAALVSLKRGVEAPVTVTAAVDGAPISLEVSVVDWA